MCRFVFNVFIISVLWFWGVRLDRCRLRVKCIKIQEAKNANQSGYFCSRFCVNYNLNLDVFFSEKNCIIVIKSILKTMSKIISAKIFLLCAITVLLLGASNTHAQYFNDVNANIYGYMNCSGNWIDVDLDGDADLLLTGELYKGERSSKHSNIFRNANRKNRFPRMQNILQNVGHSATDVGDYDNDGDDDVLLSGINSSGKYVTILYRNNRSRGWQIANSSFVGVAKGEVRLDDYNNDGKKDVIICGETQSGSYVTYIYKNIGGNKFRRINAGIEGVRHGSVDLGDYDLDGDLDLLVCGESSSARPVTAIYTNDGRDRFIKTSTEIPGVQFSDAKWGDFDSDGLLDIVITGETQDKQIITRIFQNLGDGSFVGKSFNIKGVKNGHVSWGDYDDDADLDLLVTGESYGRRIVSSVYRNDRDQGFVDISTNLTPVFYSDGEFADYDSDGDLDLFISGMTKDYRYVAKVYKNDKQLLAPKGGYGFGDGSGSGGNGSDDGGGGDWASIKMPEERVHTSYFYLISSCFCLPDSSYYVEPDYHVFYSQVFRLEVPYSTSIQYFNTIISNNDNWGRIKGSHISKGFESWSEAEEARKKMIASYRDDHYQEHYVVF